MTALDPSLVQCPVEGCGTHLQRTTGGLIRDGVMQHLQVVHGYVNSIATNDLVTKTLREAGRR